METPGLVEKEIGLGGWVRRVKALNLRQPWAHMIVMGFKTIETRTWKTRYRGPLLIVASKTKPDLVLGYKDPQTIPVEFGKAVATCRLVDCRPMVDDDSFAACFKNEPGRFAWVLEDVKRIKPFPVKGQLGLYNVEVPK